MESHTPPIIGLAQTTLSKGAVEKCTVPCPALQMSLGGTAAIRNSSGEAERPPQALPKAGGDQLPDGDTAATGSEISATGSDRSRKNSSARQIKNNLNLILDQIQI
ncbi:hypothetical protein BO71DRAFT_409440 [Aspergillus ellipticus CBS 707.79]|uniref:Uncharacterized protein n=1 Tax=Aspergillus ellipticus CBS 707.79 TaxID=1448320 RepID=A0A319ETF8_9EURO|nr:hypothetical protein BO71DRAFT_409440 [Aspergillus ellipticus CBS 707.79]